MNPPPRPPKRSDGSTAVTATQGSGGDPPPVGAAGASARTSRSDNAGEQSFGRLSSTGGGEPDLSSGCRPKAISPHDSLGVFQTRSIFHLPRRASSGYFSSDGDSLPSSPLSPVTADKATQTPSPTCQVMQHALLRTGEAHGGGLGTHQQYGHSPSPSSTRAPNAAGVMPTEAIGRELRRIGDDFNRLLLLRVEAGRPVVIPPNPLPHIHQEPTMLLCVGLLLLLIGRIMYLQGSTNSQDHSQV